MRYLLAISVILWLSAPASAGVFGGFSGDETRYLKGRDQVCSPIPQGLTTAAPRCGKAPADAVAKLGFRRPAAIAGARASFRASSAGTTLTVTSLAGDSFTWSAMDPIVGVDAVYLSVAGKMVAVELRTRMAGRVVEDVLVFVVKQPEVARAVQAATKTDQAAAVKRSASQDKSVAAGNRALTGKRWSAADKAFRAALTEADDAEARYGLAVALMRRKKTGDAIAQLEALAVLKRPDAGVWRVAARHDKSFRKLLANKRFRTAVGIDASPGRPLSAYERVVGPGDHWEQSEIRCDRPRINLALRRRPQTFKLKLRSKCGGYADTTRLSGAWAAKGNDRVELVFPNPGGKDEVFVCSLAQAKDGSGEDSMTCAEGTDMAMTLHLVRR